MQLTSTPYKYQSAFIDALFTLSALKTEKLDVDVYANDGVTVIGKKRFAGATSHTLNVANYAQSQFNVNPLWSGNPNFYKPTGRYVNVSMRCGTISSSTILSAAGGKSITYYQKLSSAPEWCKITPSQRDELAMITDNTPLYATVTLVKPNKRVVHRLPNKITEDGPVVLFVNMLTMATVIRNAGYGEVSSYQTMTIEIRTDDEVLLTQNYQIESDTRDQIRICWLNAYGQIDYYTMKCERKRSTQANKERIYTAGGYKVIGSDVETVTEMVSEFEPEATMEWLSEIIASPSVWLCTEAGFAPIDIVTSRVERNAEELCRLELAYRNPLRTAYQHH